MNSSNLENQIFVEDDDINLELGMQSMADIQIAANNFLDAEWDLRNPSNAKVAENAFALQGEIFELVQELGWKSWKDNPDMTTEQKEKIAEEFADVVAFFGNLINMVCGRTGLDTRDLAAAYQRKVLKNVARFNGTSGEEGYTGRESARTG